MIENEKDAIRRIQPELCHKMNVIKVIKILQGKEESMNEHQYRRIIVRLFLWLRGYLVR